MFVSNTEIKEAVDKLIQSFGQKNRGDLITWQEIEDVIQMEHLSHPAPYIIKRFKEWVRRNRNIILDCERKVGLRFLLEPKRVTDWTLKGQTKALRQNLKTKRDNHNAEDALLGLHFRRIKNANENNLKVAIKAQKSAVYHLRKQMGTPTIPQRQPEQE